MKFKKKWWQILWWSLFLVCALLFPVVLNVLINIPQRFPVVGTSADWLNFWGTYLSSIASAAMIFIALENIKESKRENSDNRLVQIKILAYQQEKNKIHELAEKLWAFQVSFDMMECSIKLIS